MARLGDDRYLAPDLAACANLIATGALTHAAGIPLLIILIIHLVKGPTCLCKLQTAVQVLRLKPLGRMRRATACVSQLRELCELHQGGAAVFTPRPILPPLAAPAPAPFTAPLPPLHAYLDTERSAAPRLDTAETAWAPPAHATDRESAVETASDNAAPPPPPEAS